jgi:hypothetical protein
MKLVLPLALLALALSFCNLGKRARTNSDNANTETNTANHNSNSGTGEDVARLQLIAIEYQWKQAKAAADLATLQEVFADEFINTDDHGKTYNKTQWIEKFKGGEPQLKSWKISEEKLVSFGGNTATMTFTITYTLKRGADDRSRDTDTFVRRDGRWQVVASQSSPLK